jgi:hypothetical protein
MKERPRCGKMIAHSPRPEQSPLALLASWQMPDPRLTIQGSAFPIPLFLFLGLYGAGPSICDSRCSPTLFPRLPMR